MEVIVEMETKKMKPRNNYEEINANEEITIALKSFFESYLDKDYLGYCLNLYHRIKNCKSFSLNRGKKEIWAAVIVLTIARLNFLFDKDNDQFISPDTICDFFGTKKSTTSNKASEIAKVLNIVYGQEDLSDSRIINSLSFVQLSNGLVVPMGMINKSPEERERKREEKRRLIEEKEQEKKKRQAEIKHNAAEEKKKREERYQPSLFDDF